MLAPHLAVHPQQPVSLVGDLVELELQRVLAVQLLRVNELAHDAQDAYALDPAVEAVEHRHRRGHAMPTFP